jgi:hydroxymethylpyrimidine pyrophosphatase-like HAD family hydrolase
MDITRQGVTKASGLRLWSQLTGIDLANVAGFGDSQNDQEFLSAVGWKVAMGNAVPELKAIADQVIGDCDDDGLAKYISETWL